MKGKVLKFFLVPDSRAARRTRRAIASRGARSGVVVGTWEELMQWASRLYRVPEAGEEHDDAFGQALEAIEDAFWSSSLGVAPGETLAAVKSAFIEFVSSTDPGGNFAPLDSEGLSIRTRRQLEDLLRLAKYLGERLPPSLSMIQALLAAEPEGALGFIDLYHLEGVPRLTRWQTALVEKLNCDAGKHRGATDDELNRILHEVLDSPPAGTKDSALRCLQEKLFRVVETAHDLDETLQWVGVRDFLQEAEVAAGMVQRILARNPGLGPSDIGLLVPDSFEYAAVLAQVFRLAGIPLSGLPVEHWRRDLGRELVFHFLYCRQKPAPVMALATCLSSPLMPWSREEGGRLAQRVMDGDYRLDPPSSSDSHARAMMELLRKGDEQPATLEQALVQLVSLLRGDDGLAVHLQQAKTAVERLRALLNKATDIDWVGLRRTVTPGFMASGCATEFTLEGVTVWRESQEPWRLVTHLVVLGFAQGHYPLAPAADPVFSADELESIRRSIGLSVDSPSEIQARRRELFRRQLGGVSGSVTFLVPRRDPSGERQSPSESLVFMHQLFDGTGSAEERIMDLDSADERAQIRNLAQASPNSPRSPRALQAQDLNFQRDLLALRTGPDGRMKPESPSSLEMLMVSRLAWLLRRVQAEPLQWAPESVEATLLGTLAHRVFEKMFCPGKDLPDPGRIPGQVEHFLNEAIRQVAPFFGSSRWQVERRHFIAQTVRAAQAWRDTLAVLGAEVLASEQWLQGNWCGIPIHGQADVILGLPGDRRLIVDYKRSSSKSRLARMQKGYDCQVSLYRTMLESGGPKGRAAERNLGRLCTASRAGIVYYMMNDRVFLSDTPLPGDSAIPGWRTLENDVSGEALALIERRLAEVSEGKVCLNREGEAEFFNKRAGITPYALENSPLIALFTVAGEEMP